MLTWLAENELMHNRAAASFHSFKPLFRIHRWENRFGKCYGQELAVSSLAVCYEPESLEKMDTGPVDSSSHHLIIESGW